MCKAAQNCRVQSMYEKSKAQVRQMICPRFSSVQFSHSVVSHSLQLPGSPHLLGLRRHRYSLLLLAWEDVQALFPSEEHSVTLTWDPGTKSKIALIYGAKHGAGIFSHSLLFSSFLASLEGRSQRTFIWQLRQRLRPVKPLPEVMGPGRGRGGI